ncbi:MAG TPA: DEAD/DEAH box helicase family protein [Candidatus Methylomirabilis sp.]|nr:DEAD/DEAH box helicase family protein [Candidatus Methylomirabilis sp.]
MRLEQSLVLNRYCHWLLGARSLEELKPALFRIEEGPGADGQSWFFHALAGLRGLRLSAERLREYDSRVVGYESRLRRARGQFAFKYFQYPALIYTEIYLDRLTDDPSGFASELNAFLGELRKEEPSLKDFAAFAPEDLRRLAFFMATGSGKTLLLHVNLWQILHYLSRGKHPEALALRGDGRRHFDSIILITPNEGLSRQHLEEFNRSAIDAALLVEDRTGGGLLGPRVKVIEIHKLAEEPSREGVSVVLEELGSANLVFVDEGHKGTGTEARTWKTRQKQLSANGFLFEYSATFAQAIGASSPRVKDELLREYGKAIIFDYSYRHFYDDGYGKDFSVLNLARAPESHAHELLLGGLLSYYQQLHLFRERGDLYRPYNLERPLWVFLGSSVNAVYSREGRKRSDVAAVVAFIRHFLADSAWAVKSIRRILRGESGFADQETHQDLFAERLSHLKGVDAEGLYKQIAEEVFRGRGGLEVWELKGAEGELALRVSAPAGKENPYFGVINIGDVSAFKKHLLDNLGLEVREDRFRSSLFAEVNAPLSCMSLLIGSKKFIEGWSSWRVSSMGLLNMGKGEGPQVIQLFGRGVRLKGKKWTLKRSHALPEEAPHPNGIEELETLFIFGWNADYVQAFREMIEREEIPREVRVPVRTLFDPWPRLPVPRPAKGYSVQSETWRLSAEALNLVLDLTPRVAGLRGREEVTGGMGERRRVDFTDSMNAAILDTDELFAELTDYKASRGYGNLLVPKDSLIPILRKSSVYVSERHLDDPSLIQESALRVLKAYMERFVAYKEREAEARHLEPAWLPAVHESIPRYYTVRVSSEDLLKQLLGLLERPTELYAVGGKPLPRLHVERHLFTPLLLDPAEHGLPEMSVSPLGLGQGEEDLATALGAFWKAHWNTEPFRRYEVFLMRNAPRVGVGFFQRSGFYPDFILWIRDKRAKATRIRFLEPHGMHHGGLSGNREKIEALMELVEISREALFRDKKITMDGYILTQSKLEEIPGADEMDWSALKRDYRVLRQEGDYFAEVLTTE